MVRTAPHRTAPHRTAPHRTAPHRTAPHRTGAMMRTTVHRTKVRTAVAGPITHPLDQALIGCRNRLCQGETCRSRTWSRGGAEPGQGGGPVLRGSAHRVRRTRCRRECRASSDGAHPVRCGTSSCAESGAHRQSVRTAVDSIRWSPLRGVAPTRWTPPGGAHSMGSTRFGIGRSTRWMMPGIVTTARRSSAASGTGHGHRGARRRCRCGSGGAGAGAPGRRRTGVLRPP